MEISVKKSYILDNTNELILNDRKEILQIIFNSQFRNKLNEKGNGTQVRLENLTDELITKIYEFIYIRLKDQSNDVIV
jgi:hypothetical protein